MTGKNPQVVEIKRPLTFGQKISKAAAENYRKARRAEKQASTNSVTTHNPSVELTSPVTIPAIPKPKQKIKTVAYCRISTGMESQLSSIENQRKHFEQEIRSNPDYEFVDVYLEIGVSGTKTELRPELQRMIQDCREGKISLILTKSISRFSRSTSDCLEMVRTLTALGVDIYFEKESINTMDHRGRGLKCQDSASFYVRKTVNYGI